MPARILIIFLGFGGGSTAVAAREHAQCACTSCHSHRGKRRGAFLRLMNTRQSELWLHEAAALAVDICKLRHSQTSSPGSPSRHTSFPKNSCTPTSWAFFKLIVRFSAIVGDVVVVGERDVLVL